jgi:hypothetical protein
MRGGGEGSIIILVKWFLKLLNPHNEHSRDFTTRQMHLILKA